MCEKCLPEMANLCISPAVCKVFCVIYFETVLLYVEQLRVDLENVALDPSLNYIRDDKQHPSENRATLMLSVWKPSDFPSEPRNPK